MIIQTKIKNLNNYKIYLKIEEAIHEFLQKNGYLKIDLPVLSPFLIPESYLEIFKTEFTYLGKKQKLYLTPSPELFLKRLLAYGIGNCYYLGKSFRNAEKSSNLHSFEFTMLEYYRIKANYFDIAEELLELLKFIAKKLYQKEKINYNGNNISFKKWEKLTVSQAFRKLADFSQKELSNQKLFIKKAAQKGYVTKGFSFEDLFSQIYVQEIESNLGKNGYPTLIYDYPKQFAALAKLNSDGKTAQRFEFYISGVELGDCYTELTNWQENERRFKQEQYRRKILNKIKHPIDKGFIKALKYGLVDCAGIAIGFERLAMIFANADSIDELKLVSIT